MRGVFLRFLKTYILVLIIPVLLSFAIYFVAYAIIADITHEASVLALDQARSIYEQRFNEISQMNYQLYTNSYAISLSHLSGDDQLLYSRIRKTQNNLPKYNVTNNFILDYYILFANSDKVINDRIAYTARDFFQSFLHYSTISYNEWLTGVTADAARGACWQSRPVVLDKRYYGSLDSCKINAVTCLMNTGKNFRDTMSVFMLIDTRELAKIISPVIYSPEDYACIISRDGLLFDIHPNEAYLSYIQQELAVQDDHVSRTYSDVVAGERVFVTTTYSEALDWHLVSIRPYQTVMANLLAVQRVMICVACISILIGIGLAVFFSIRKNAPAMSLFHDNERFQALIEEQKPIISSTFMERLFNGLVDSRQLQMFLRYLDMPAGQYYASFVIQFYDDDLLNLDYYQKIQLIVREAVSSVRGLYFHDFGSFRTAFFLNCDCEEACLPVARQTIDTLIAEIRPKIPCKIAVAIGKVCTDLQMISLSLNSAVEALNYRDWDIDYQVIAADTVNPAGQHLLRNDEIILMLNQLEHSVKNGNSQEVRDLYQRIDADFTRSRDMISTSAANMLFFSILNLISNLLDPRFEAYGRIKAGADDLSRNIIKNSPSENIHYLRKLSMEICSATAAVNRDRHSAAITEILDFLNGSYSNPELSLTLLSDRYALSETYLSLMFKKHTGENISAYLENLRLSKARDLLQNDKLAIQEITGMVGYHSANTFNKAFKKKYGVPPSAYRIQRLCRPKNLSNPDI